MTANFFYKSKLTLAIIFFLFVIDRLFKHIALKTWSQGFFVFPNFELKLYLNPGLAFSVPLSQTFIYLFFILVFVGLLFWLRKLIASNKLAASYLVIVVLVSGFSNLLDRLYWGAVIDFIHLWVFPVFNLADLYISIAVIGLFIYFWSNERRVV